jgi:hypothetical protein
MEWRARRSRDSGLRQKRGVSDRHGRSFRAGHGFHLGTELLSERLDDTRAEAGFCLSKDAVRPAYPVVSDRKLPIHPCGIIPDGYPAIALVVGERMLQSIHDKLKLGFGFRCAPSNG